MASATNEMGAEETKVDELGAKKSYEYLILSVELKNDSKIDSKDLNDATKVEFILGTFTMDPTQTNVHGALKTILNCTSTPLTKSRSLKDDKPLIKEINGTQVVIITTSNYTNNLLKEELIKNINQDVMINY